MSNIEKLEELERRLGAGQTQLGKTYRKLGHLESDLGFSSLGLADVLRAYALQKSPDADVAELTLEELRKKYVVEAFPDPETPFELAVQLGEGLRLYARDVNFSRKGNALKATAGTLKACLKCFDHAVDNCSTDRSDQQAWLWAHRGAARTMTFWLKKSLGTKVVEDVFGPKFPKDVFSWAKSDFDAALREQPNYPWCRRFLAFLFTIQGTDYEEAELHLAKARLHDDTASSALERSKAILFLNLVDQEENVAYDRARLSLGAAVNAMREDPEDFVAAYFAAASRTVLAQQPDAKEKRWQEAAESAIASARVRCENSLSQAYACLIGLGVLDYQVQKKKSPDSPALLAIEHSCSQYLSFAKDAKIDLETRIVFDREFNRLVKIEGLSPELKKNVQAFLDSSLTHAQPDTTH